MRLNFIGKLKKLRNIVATKTIDGKTYNVYTDKDWERDKTLKVQVGQLIEPSIYHKLLNSVPPKGIPA